MKVSFLLFIMLVFCCPVWANAIYGKIVSSDPVVKVISQDGIPAEYNFANSINTAFADDDSIAMTDNGLLTRCGSYLGQLAEDFTVTVVDGSGNRKTAVVRAAFKKIRKVNVFGMCEEGLDTLTELQIQIEKGDPVELQ